MNGFWRDDGLTSSTLIFSICLAREVAWRAFDLLAEKRRTKSCSSATFSLALALAACCCVARLRRGRHVVVVVARIDLQRAVVHVGHVGADLVQEVAVVRDDDHGRVALVQHVFQPADGVDVEVVGRLVEQQDVGIREQRLRQQHAQLPARRDVAHRAVGAGRSRRRRPAAARRRAPRRCSRRIRRTWLRVRPPSCSRRRSLPDWRRSRRARTSPPTSRCGPSSPRRARACPRRRTGPGAACRGARSDRASRCRTTAPDRRRESS